ncbi:solute symporter family transporter [Fonsecaea erecta]|uniref:Solute symporter family transporter n=1 Tax=Fonsecaea erecta TaxID=1367422 RepID=A0A178Z8D1_9EURO|nr:solute symporter family transporter [Fonsecaea erecta]OAP56027.1 solute symporter family transporter [Fonsecaea erecta]
MSTYSVGPELKVLSPGIGYGIIAGIGAVFCLVMILTTKFQNRYFAFSTKQSEEFNTASRNVKPGLIVAGIVSAWTWSATLLTSSTFAYSFGISGPMWYAALGSSQVILFALLSLRVKRDVPGAHTFPEIVLSRHGKVAHAIYTFFGWVVNMFVGATLVLGGSQVLAGLSGVNVYAACFIIPIAVAAYVIQGGLRSTFVADYLHTVILFVAIFIFAFTLYTSDEYTGSPGKVYDLLVEAGKQTPLAGNRDGSWLTFRSSTGIKFAIVIFLGSFSTVWLDQAYWQRAIASKPETSVKAYLLGGLAWYGIPYGFATVMGLGAVALTGSPSFPTYPNPLNAAQVGGGFAAPATAIALMGKNGAALMLLLLFMAVTSAASAELIAVSSLWTFDVYKLYINPSASSSKLVKQAHYGIVAYALLLSAFCCALSASGIDITWILTVGGVLVGGGGIPLGLIVLFPERMSTAAAIGAPLIASPLGLTAWFVTTHIRSGTINAVTTGDLTNALVGSATACGTGAVVAVVFSLVFPYKYTSNDPAHIARVQKIQGTVALVLHGREELTGSVAPDTTSTTVVDEKGVETTKAAVGVASEQATTALAPVPTTGTTTSSAQQPTPGTATGNDVVDYLLTNHIEPLDLKAYQRARRLAFWGCGVFVVVAIVLFPFTFYGTGYIFTKAAFTGWVVVSFVWVFFSALTCIIWPVLESYPTLRDMTKMLLNDTFRAKKNKDGQEEEGGGEMAERQQHAAPVETAFTSPA